MSMKDFYYLDELCRILTTKNYDFVKKHANYLSKPRYTVKNSQKFVKDITYRKVNDWDSKNIISGTRDNVKAGWRKFSIIDIIRFYIISDLRKFGLDSKKIKNILNNISNSPFDIKINGKLYKENFLQIEYFTFLCLNGIKILLLIDDKDDVFFLIEKEVILAHFSLDEASSPVIILPFFLYIKKLFNKAIEIDPKSTVKELFEIGITEKEKKILDIINKNNYESITIKKQNGEIKTITAKEILIGNFSNKDIIDAIKEKDYQQVSAVVKNGKKVNITREETFKL